MERLRRDMRFCMDEIEVEEPATQFKGAIVVYGEHIASQREEISAHDVFSF